MATLALGSTDANTARTSSPTHLRPIKTSSGTGATNDDAGDSPPGSPRSASVSLQAAATMNAGLQHEHSRRSSSSSMNRHYQPSSGTGRRRSTVLMNLHHNDPTIPSPGEMVNDHGSGLHHSSPHSMASSPILTARDPHHKRAPSLGGLHQEMEEEQEAHVNRMLKLIRKEQEEVRHLHEGSRGNSSGPTAGAGDDTSAIHSDRGTPTNLPKPARSPTGSSHHQKRPSGTPSGTASPGLRPTSVRMDSGDLSLASRDEIAHLQAERLSLIRENQMLKRRVMELEDEITEIASKPAISHSPSHHSHLVQSQSAIVDERPAKEAIDTAARD